MWVCVQFIPAELLQPSWAWINWNIPLFTIAAAKQCSPTCAFELLNGIFWPSWNISYLLPKILLQLAKAIQYDNYAEENVSGREIDHVDGGINLPSSLYHLSHVSGRSYKQLDYQLFTFMQRQRRTVGVHLLSVFSRGQKRVVSIRRMFLPHDFHILLTHSQSYSNIII